METAQAPSTTTATVSDHSSLHVLSIGLGAQAAMGSLGIVRQRRAINVASIWRGTRWVKDLVRGERSCDALCQMTVEFSIAAAALCSLCRTRRVEQLDGGGMARFVPPRAKWARPQFHCWASLLAFNSPGLLRKSSRKR